MKSSHRFKKTIFFSLLATVLLTSCFGPSGEIVLIESNINAQKSYSLDYDNAFKNGFIIPSKQHDNIDDFQLRFQLNDFRKSEELYYKVYYQNESYKFQEEIDGVYNPLASENFYGSWEDVDETFKAVQKTAENTNTIINSCIKITGNPRSEKKYFGSSRHYEIISEEQVNDKMLLMKSKYSLQRLKKWAEANNTSVEEQLRKDARWVLSENHLHTNNKWKRNPRVGKYSLLIVVTNKEGLIKIPEKIKNISLAPDSNFVNPYYYFLHGDGKELLGVKTLVIQDFISVTASVPLANGIYVDFDNKRFESKGYFNKYVGDSEDLYANAAFEYKHAFQSNTEFFMNVPVHADFLKKGYSQKEYKENIKATVDERIKTFFTNTRYPGESFGVDAEKKAIWFKNPANKEGENRKENVGIKTRHGLTYGKYTYKIKMAELLTKENIWTGITNAIWMINEGGDWNKRRVCNKEGFMPFYSAGKGEERVSQISYSEMDFEILKAAETYPKSSYKDKKERNDPASHQDKVMIACTNWDMACKQPVNFDIGLHHIDYKGQTFNIHRWNEFYNALTSKIPELDDDLFSGEYYYFQLEWKPNEIIWRVGPEKENLHVVGFMNDKVTTIPNNQMLAVISQEYHFSKWWPKSPFKQEDIPFPSEDLNGIIYSLEIE